MMKKVLAAVVGATFLVSFSPAVGKAETACPEVDAAKAMLKQQAAASDVKAPRSLAGARSQDIQAPRSQDVQAPRSQDVQAPRSQDVQAPRSQDVQAPRGPNSQTSPGRYAPSASGVSERARTLVREAEAACQVGDTTRASQKALAALEIMKQ